MGRKKLYQTDAERKAARRLTNQKYQAGRRERESKRQEAENFGLENIQLENVVHRPTREERQDRFNAEIDRKSTVDTAQDVFTFNFEVPEKFRHQLLKRFAQTMRDFLDGLDYRNKYVIRYNLGDRWRTIPLDDRTAVSFISQLNREGFLNEARDRNTTYVEENNDLFPVSIAEFHSITIARLVGRNARPVEEGGFFKSICEFPINLEKYMIFNKLDERSAKIICEDNCVVYACRQAGVDDDLILNMKRFIMTRQLPQTKLKVMAEELGVQFEVTLWDGDKKIYKPKGEVRCMVKLYLIENYYLIKDRIAISPYFIKHYEEIMN
jgi:hypothetical protein